MLRACELVGPLRINFEARCYERGKYVRGTHREGHNVFTTTGRDWLAHHSAWYSIGGGGDVPYTNRRVRWCGLGEGSQPEVEGVTSLVTPVEATAGQYLAAVQAASFPVGTSVEFYKEFGVSEVSFGSNPIVAITEAGLFVDVFAVSSQGGQDDSAVGAGDTTLNPASTVNAPVAYKTFEVINKTADFTLIIRWTFEYA